MKYLNLSSGVSQDPMAIRATDSELGVWLRLQCYCTQQMNGGVIQGCKEWTDDMWMRAAGIRALSVSDDGPMWHYNGMGWLIVHLYNQEAEDAYRRKQAMGKVYIERRWAAQKERKIIQMQSSKSKSSGNTQKDNAP